MTPVEFLGDVADYHYCHVDDTVSTVLSGPISHWPLSERVWTELVFGEPLAVESNYHWCASEVRYVYGSILTAIHYYPILFWRSSVVGGREDVGMLVSPVCHREAAICYSGDSTGAVRIPNELNSGNSPKETGSIGELVEVWAYTLARVNVGKVSGTLVEKAVLP